MLQIRDFSREDKAVYIPISSKIRTCKADDILIGRYGASVGQIHRGMEGAYNVALIRTNPDTGLIDRGYFYYFLISGLFQSPLAKISITRSAQAGFSKEDISDIEVPLPPLPVQNRIVAILDEAFAAIGQAIANTERNLKNARELFESYLNDVFTRKGEGWTIELLDNVCNKIQDGAHHSPQVLYSSQGHNLFPYLTSKNIRKGYLKLDKVDYCDASFHEEIYPRCNPELGDVLLTKDGANTGNVTINTLNEPFSLLSSVCLIKPDRTKLVPQFLVYYLWSQEGFKQITGQMTGAAIKRIILKTIKASVIPRPLISVQEQVVYELDALLAKTQIIENIYQQKLKVLTELKQSILQKAFTGELTDDLPL